MKEYATKFYKSKQWQKVRSEYAASVGGLCENCLKKGIYRPGDIVHHIEHITPDNIYNPEITLSFKNLRLVCRECHAEEHNERMKARRWFIDADGRVQAKINCG